MAMVRLTRLRHAQTNFARFRKTDKHLGFTSQPDVINRSESFKFW
jgi:hypothetical protein